MLKKKKLFDKIFDEFKFRIHILQNDYMQATKYVHIHFKASTLYLLRGINRLFVLSNISLVTFLLSGKLEESRANL